MNKKEFLKGPAAMMQGIWDFMTFDPGTVKLWTDVLKEYSVEDVTEAVERYAAHSSAQPKPADIREHLRDLKIEAAANAIEKASDDSAKCEYCYGHGYVFHIMPRLQEIMEYCPKCSKGQRLCPNGVKPGFSIEDFKSDDSTMYYFGMTVGELMKTEVETEEKHPECLGKPVPSVYTLERFPVRILRHTVKGGAA